VEQLLITERSRLALANIELQEVRFDQEFGSDKPLDGKRINRLRKLLDDITVTGPYGPAAISMLAQLAMGEGNYTRASELWYFAINNMPWHPAVRDAHVAMPYSLHQFRTDDQVYGEYTRAANRLGERQETLSALRQTMARLPPVELASALSFSNRRQARATLFALEENIGDDSLARWLADEESQRLANRWLRLNEAFSQLRSRQQNLDVLLAVDKEQQHRTRKAADRLKSDNLNLRLTRVEAKIVKLEAVPTFDELRAVATPEEMNLVDQLDLLAQKATKLSAGASVLQRIEYLQGLLMYRVFTNLSVRVQNRQVEAERLTQLLTREKQRAIGIEQAAKNLSGSTSVSSKIKLLASRTNRLYHRTGTVLKDSSEQLLAHVNREISTEISALGEQLVYVRLAMARIDDRRLAISGVAP
jgi:hypothetical protein